MTKLPLASINRPLPLDDLSLELPKHCRETSLKCGEFDNDFSLRAVLAIRELHPFRRGLPEATNGNARIDMLLDIRKSSHFSDGGPMQPLFLAALRDRYQPGDALRSWGTGSMSQLSALRRWIVYEPQR